MQLVEIVPMSKTIRFALLAALSGLGLSINSAALGAPCTDDDFAAAIDSSGAAWIATWREPRIYPLHAPADLESVLNSV